MLTIDEVAYYLDGMEYDFEIDDDTIQIIKKNDIVIVFGQSDDLLEMTGAFEEEFGAWKGTTIISNHGRKIKAIWNDVHINPPHCFIYQTDIEHECFTILEDKKPYCKGIVFKALKDETWKSDQ